MTNMGTKEMLVDMAKSFNVVKKTSQSLVYFGCIDISLLLGRNDNVLFIDYIRSNDQGYGFASRTLNEICMYADRHRVALWLEIKPLPPYDGGTPKLNETQLMQWYNRHGFLTEEFISVSGKTKAEMGGFIDMVRQPVVNGKYS